MEYHTQADMKSLDRSAFGELLANTVLLGFDPTTIDALMLTYPERTQGLCILGKSGLGKSSLMASITLQDIMNNMAVILLDAHEDLIRHIIAQMPDEQYIYKTSCLDMEDETHPFGLNIFNMPIQPTSVAWARAVDRIMHIFEVHWPEVTEQQNFPRYLRACVITLLANPGSTLVDMYPMLTNDTYRHQLLQNVKDETVHEFWRVEYDELSNTDRYQRVRPLLGRLESLFTGRPLLRNILGQSENTIDFRKAIENKEIILIKLPVKTLKQDASLLGTIIIAQIHAATFSYGDLLEHKRPGFSLFVDEFQHFATSDFSEMITEGRKFGVRVTLAHQYRRQLPEFLRSSTLAAGTIVCFQPTPEDSREMAHLFLNGDAFVRPDDIDPHPVDYLVQYGADDPDVQVFIDFYLRYMKTQRSYGKVKIKNPGINWSSYVSALLRVPEPGNSIEVDDPLPELNHLLYEVMKTGNSALPISPRIVRGFANCGLGFYSAFKWTLNKANLLEPEISYPAALVVDTAYGQQWTRQPEDGREQMYHFLFGLRCTMKYLSQNPIGKKSVLTVSDVASDLLRLPKRAAYVHSGSDVGVIYTDDNLPGVSGDELKYRLDYIRVNTRHNYCKKLEPTPPSIVKKVELSRWEEVQ